jgi:hypothetical protein
LCNKSNTLLTAFAVPADTTVSPPNLTKLHLSPSWAECSLTIYIPQIMKTMAKNRLLIAWKVNKFNLTMKNSTLWQKNSSRYYAGTSTE